MHKYRRVAYEDRCQISSYLQANWRVPAIAKRLGFHKTTIYREVGRNGSRGRYDPLMASKKAYDRFRSCRRRKRLTKSLKETVLNYMAMDWSPEQITGRFRCEGHFMVSHQTIYRNILGHRKEAKLLRRFGRRGAGRTRQQKAKMRGKRMIWQRPTIVEQRKRLGDWERDGMYGAHRKQLLVLTERKSRLTKLSHLQDTSGREVNVQTNETLGQLGKRVFTLTNDNGSEFSDRTLMKYPTYYCSPMRPDQRGTVENAIGLLRQYIKRKTDLNSLSGKDLRAYEAKLNLRPRKCLDYRTPHEVFYNTKVALVM